MKIIKTILSVFICLVMLFSSIIISNANTVDENRLAFEKFYETVKTAYSSAGKEIFIEYDENRIYTQSDIDVFLDLLKKDKIEVEIVDNHTDNKSSRLMPAMFYGEKTVTISSINGIAFFRLTFKGTLDLQGNNIMGMDSLDLVYFGGANYTSHSLTYNWERSSNMSNTSCFVVFINGYVFFTANILGIEYSINEPVGENVYIDTLDYI